MRALCVQKVVRLSLCVRERSAGYGLACGRYSVWFSFPFCWCLSQGYFWRCFQGSCWLTFLCRDLPKGHSGLLVSFFEESFRLWVNFNQADAPIACVLPLLFPSVSRARITSALTQTKDSNRGAVPVHVLYTNLLFHSGCFGEAVGNSPHIWESLTIIRSTHRSV